MSLVTSRICLSAWSDTSNKEAEKKTVVKQADKGGGIALLDRGHYEQEERRQMTRYHTKLLRKIQLSL